MSRMRASPAVFIIPAAMLLLALAEMPYSFYTVLKLVTMLSAGWIATVMHDWQREWWAATFVLLAVIFNPIVPIHPGREAWFYLNIAAAITYVVGLVISILEERDQRAFDRKYNQPRA